MQACAGFLKRRRFFCIGLLGEEDGFLNSIIDANLDSKPMTIRDYMGDELDIEYYYRHPRNYNRRGIFSIDEPSPTVRESIDLSLKVTRDTTETPYLSRQSFVLLLHLKGPGSRHSLKISNG